MVFSFWHRIRTLLSQAPSRLQHTVFLPELDLQQLMQLQQHLPVSGVRRPASASLVGQHRSRQQGRGMELSEIRNYQPGDDIRLMDWKVTARTRRPHTKVFLEERERPVHLVVDLCASMLFGSIRSKAEQAAKSAAVLGWGISQQGDRCGGLVFNGSEHHLIKPRSRHKGLLALLKSSCEIGHKVSDSASRSQPGRMNQLLHQLAAQHGHGSLIVIISDFWSLDLEDVAVLSKLTRHHTLVAIQIHDPLEQELPATACFLTDGRTNYTYDGASPSDQELYRKAFDQHSEALQVCLQKVRGHFISLSTQDAPADKLKQLFVQGSR